MTERTGAGMPTSKDAVAQKYEAINTSLLHGMQILRDVELILKNKDK